MMRKLAAEFFGTSCLVFAGTGAIVINEISGGAPQSPRSRSAFAPRGRMAWGNLLPYATSQSLGALRALFGNVRGLGATHPAGGQGQSFGLEALCAGRITGASMNPARSLGPALLSGDRRHLWLYLAAPAGGALLGVVISRCVQGSEAAPRV